MRWLLLIVTALLLAGGIGWWMDHGSGRAASRTAEHHRTAGDRGPTLYRWVDARGVVNITDTPPKGRRYTIMRIDPDRNIVPGAKVDAATTAHQPH